MTPKALVSWSGGKDSCLALHVAAEQGFDGRAAVVMRDEAGERSRSHALPPGIVTAQAQAMGRDLSMSPTPWQRYEQDFVAALRSHAAAGFTHAVFGEFDLQAHHDWEESVCAAAGLTVALPLWR